MTLQLVRNPYVSIVINSNDLTKDELGKMTPKSVSGKTKLSFTSINICIFASPASNSYTFTENYLAGKKEIKDHPSRNCKRLRLM